MNFRIPSIVAVGIWATFSVYVAAFTIEAYADTKDGMPDIIGEKNDNFIKRTTQRNRGRRRNRRVDGRARNLLRDFTQEQVPPLISTDDLSSNPLTGQRGPLLP